MAGEYMLDHRAATRWRTIGTEDVTVGEALMERIRSAVGECEALQGELGQQETEHWQDLFVEAADQAEVYRAKARRAYGVAVAAVSLAIVAVVVALWR